MIKVVIKKNGSKVPFDVDKIRKAIFAASKDVGLSTDSAQSVASRVISSVLQYTSNQEEIYVDELRSLVLEGLDDFAPNVSKAWKEYDQKNKTVPGDII